MKEKDEIITHVIGIISDTHGYLSKSARIALKGVSLIVHAGDIDNLKIYRQLQRIAPLKAVCGNTDFGFWANALPVTGLAQIAKTNIYILHDLEELDIKPEVADIQVVVSGHTHRPKINNQNGVLYINPGSASSPRHSGPPSMVKLKIKGNQIETELIELKYP